MSHGSNLKNLFRKSVHKRLNPVFKNIFENCDSKNVALEMTEYGAPKMLKLAEDIGFNTKLEYEGDFLKLNYSLLTEELWKEKRPCFVKEEKKVLDVIHALLLSAETKRESEIAQAAITYSQTKKGFK